MERHTVWYAQSKHVYFVNVESCMSLNSPRKVWALPASWQQRLCVEGWDCLALIGVAWNFSMDEIWKKKDARHSRSRSVSKSLSDADAGGSGCLILYKQGLSFYSPAFRSRLRNSLQSQRASLLQRRQADTPAISVRYETYQKELAHKMRRIKER